MEKPKLRRESSVKRKRRESSPMKKLKEEVVYKLQNSHKNHSKELFNLVQGWTKIKPDVCIISEDRNRIFTQRYENRTFTSIICLLGFGMSCK